MRSGSRRRSSTSDTSDARDCRLWGLSTSIVRCTPLRLTWRRMTGTVSPGAKMPLRVSLEDAIGLLHGSCADPRRPLEGAIADLRRGVTGVKPIGTIRQGRREMSASRPDLFDMIAIDRRALLTTPLTMPPRTAPARTRGALPIMEAVKGYRR